MTRALRVVILGRQGSGKGTQCARISSTWGMVHVSTGDMLRAAVSEGTDLGLQAKEVMDRGGLVSDDIMNGIVAERLAKRDVVDCGVLLDGFPRTPAQAAALEEILAETPLDLALSLDVPVEEVVTRMLDRGREDDTEEAIRRRLDLYESETAPLLSWFEERDLLRVVDGLGDEDEVFDRIQGVLEEVTEPA